MAVVKDYIHPTIGCRIIVRDDVIRSTSAEEMQERHRRLDEVASQIYYNIMSDPVRREVFAQRQREKYGTA